MLTLAACAVSGGPSGDAPSRGVEGADGRDDGAGSPSAGGNPTAADAPGTDPGSASQASTTVVPLEKDLAVVLNLDDPHLVKARERIGAAPLFASSLLGQVDTAYHRTSVGRALQTENRYEDWHVVSFRIAPCAALGPTPKTADELCWPEVRLVLQPILRKVRIHERYAEAFGDDRAIHALYDGAPEGVLTAGEAQRARALVARVRSAPATEPFAPLTAAELAEFASLRDRVARALVADAVALRGSLPVEAFRGVGLRPESNEGGAVARGLGERVRAFFAKHATTPQLRAVTSFSLPEGREPAHLDEWVFLSFRHEGGRLVQETITVTSPTDGRVLASLGPSPRASQTRDDESLYELDDTTLGALRESVLLGPSDTQRLRSRIASRKERLVANTTCASCHKLNPLRFDFHNMSYLEDRDVTIAPRVVEDVALDLAWFAAHR